MRQPHAEPTVATPSTSRSATAPGTVRIAVAALPLPVAVAQLGSRGGPALSAEDMGEVVASLLAGPTARPALGSALAQRLAVLASPASATAAAQAVRAAAAEATALAGRGQGAAAVTLMRRTAADLAHAWGYRHPLVLRAEAGVGCALVAAGMTNEGRALLARTLMAQRERLGVGHDDALATQESLAAVLADHGELDRAAALLAEVVAARAGAADPVDQLALACSQHRLGLVAARRGDFVAAEAELREALAGLRQIQGEAGPAALAALADLAVVLGQLGKHVDAELLHRRCLLLRQGTLGSGHADTLASANNLAAALMAAGRAAEARPILAAAVVAAGGRDPVFAAVLAVRLGRCLAALGELADAEAALVDGHAALVAAVGHGHPRTLEALTALLRLLEARGQRVRAANLRAAAGRAS